MQNEKNGKFLNSQIENMRSAQAARYTGLSESTLAKLRMRHNRADGPKYLKITGCVVYRRADLDVWMDQHIVGGLTDA
jgi:predicted DNA-binding transcriptional regulator AlpA